MTHRSGVGGVTPMRDALCAGVVVLVLLAALVTDVVVEWLREVERRDDERARRAALLRELRRHNPR